MKLNKKIIAITGSIATGKSSVCNIIKENGYKIIDADLIAHDILNNEIVIKKIELAFGLNLNQGDKINRSKLGEFVFGEKKRLEKLNEITHKAIFQKINELIEDSVDEIIFVDIPLLIEIKDKLREYKFFPDQIWLVYAKKDVQIKRLMERDLIDKEYALKKINSQTSVDEKKKYCDLIINNNFNMEDLKKEVLEKIKNL